MTDRAAFGLELRRARERRGLSLDAIADLTKVSAGYYSGLERGDLSRWPSGIFRRAFVRSYAEAVGLDSEDTVARFVRLFPDPHAEPSPHHGVPTSNAAHEEEPVDAPRLLLAESRPGSGNGRVETTLRGCAAGLVDIALAAVPAAAIAPFLGWSHFWLVVAAIGFVGHVTVLAATGQTPGSWLVLRSRRSGPLVHETPATVRRRAEEPVPPTPMGRRHQLRPLPGGRATRSRRVSH